MKLRGVLTGVQAFLEANPDEAENVAESIIGVFMKAGKKSPAKILWALHAFADAANDVKFSLRDPNIWINRPFREDGSRENPAQFIKREFKQERKDGTLTRPMLMSIKRLYNAYAKHIGRYPEDDLNIPDGRKSRFTTPEETLAYRRREARRREAVRRKNGNGAGGRHP